MKEIKHFYVQFPADLKQRYILNSTLQNLAIKNGYKWDNKSNSVNISFLEEPRIYFSINNKRMYILGGSFFTKISFEEAIIILSKPNFKVGDGVIVKKEERIPFNLINQDYSADRINKIDYQKNLNIVSTDRGLRLNIVDEKENVKPKFKIGQWLYFNINNSKHSYVKKSTNCGVFKFNGISADGITARALEGHLWVDHNFYYNKKSDCYCNINICRPATQEEIIKYTNYYADRISIGGANFSIQQFYNILNFNYLVESSITEKNLNCKIKSITLDSGKTLSIEEIEKIVEEYKL